MSIVHVGVEFEAMYYVCPFTMIIHSQLALDMKVL